MKTVVWLAVFILCLQLLMGSEGAGHGHQNATMNMPSEHSTHQMMHNADSAQVSDCCQGHCDCSAGPCYLFLPLNRIAITVAEIHTLYTFTTHGIPSTFPETPFRPPARA